MKRGLAVVMALVPGLFLFSCSSSEEDDPTGDTVVIADGDTIPDGSTGDGGDDLAGTDEDTAAQCTPNETAECYHGPSGSRDRGICKAGLATCGASGYWGPCEGEILPQPEICHNDIDENCDGEDGTEENTADYDSDGYTYCTGDCCEFTSECQFPALVNPAGYDFPGNGIDDNCDGTVDEVVACDTGLSESSSEPMDMARSIDICPPAEGKDYGLISASLSLADGTGTPLAAQHKIFSAGFGTVIKPHTGSAFLMLSSGTAGNPYTSTEEDLAQNSSAPADWYQANGNQFPSSPACGMGTPGEEPVNDPIMLTVTTKVPMNARAFSVDIYFFSREFPEYVCDYNDFFLVLLDSSYTSGNPDLQNPADKNLAMDAGGNPVGINLAPAGLFRVCCQGGGLACGYTPGKDYGQFCTLGPGELAGTGLYESSKEGGTGWLVTKGNVLPGEQITVRFAIWDTRDNVLDSMVLIDNFRWYPVEVEPGTSIQQ